MASITRGQRVKLSDLTRHLQIQVGISVDAPAGLELDVSCFGVDASNRLSDDRYFVFYNQKASPHEEIVSLGAHGMHREVFRVALDRLPASIHKLVFAVTLDGAGTMAQIQGGALRLLAEQQEVGVFAFTGADFRNEKAVIVGELYLKDVWRFSAVGQGFAGGLSALLEHFGGEEEAQEPLPQLSTAVKPLGSSGALSPALAPSTATARIVLNKPDQSHKVILGRDTANTFVVRAQWTDNGDTSGDNDDLDLRVGLLLPDGQMQMVHADDLGVLSRPPYVEHQGDVRQPGEEVVKVRADISRLLGGRVALVFSVYSAVQNGVVSVASLRPRMRMEFGSQTVECIYDFAHSVNRATEHCIYTYVIGTAVIDGDTVEIRASGVVSSPHSEATPRLRWSNKREPILTMDGPELFKLT